MRDRNRYPQRCSGNSPGRADVGPRPEGGIRIPQSARNTPIRGKGDPDVNTRHLPGKGERRHGRHHECRAARAAAACERTCGSGPRAIIPAAHGGACGEGCLARYPCRNTESPSTNRKLKKANDKFQFVSGTNLRGKLSMLTLIIEKEIRDLVSTARFAVTFGICSLLILLTFYVGARTYALQTEQYEAARKEQLRQLEGVTDWSSVRSARVFLPPPPLA